MGGIAKLQALALSALGCAWRKHFPWLRAGYVGKSNTLTVGCKDCALHSAKYKRAGSDAQLSAYVTFSLQPETTWKHGDFGITLPPSTT